MLNALIIEKECAIAEMYSEILVTQNVGTRITEYGKDAIKIFNENTHFDLIVFSWIMPDISGKELYKEVRRCLPNCHIITIHAFGKTAEIEELNLPGPHSIIRYPVDIPEIIEIISNLKQQNSK